MTVANPGNARTGERSELAKKCRRKGNGGIEFAATMEAIFTIASTWRQPLAVGILFIILVWESAWPFFGFFRMRSRERMRHGARNITLGLINTVVVAALFIHLWSKVAHWSWERSFGILNSVSLPGWQHLIGAVMLLDLWTYWWHRFNHTIPFLWRFHKVHHSDPHMDVTTASRFHIGEIVISSLLRLAVIPLGGITLAELAVFETFLFANTQLHHANVGLHSKVDRLVRIFATTPAMHKVHHSAFTPETNSNYTALLSVWDRLFRSFRLRPDPSGITFGLEDTKRPDQQTLAGLLKMPTEKPEPSRGATVDS
jgi:sterol desaturase/sphingolipid hydroxylase (fatty acid hydroxylase superfamily)